MKTLHLSIIAIFFSFLFGIYLTENYHAFGDGLMPIQNKNTTMRILIQSSPTPLNLQPPQDRQIHLKFFDANTNKPIENVTFGMNVTKGSTIFLQNAFWTQSGSFTLNLKPGERYLWTANPDHDPMDGLYYSKGDQIDVLTSYLTGDPYNFEIQPLSYGVGDNVHFPPMYPNPQNKGIKFETTLNLLDTYNKTLVPDSSLSSDNIPELEKQFGSIAKITLVHGDSILILNQTTQKLAYKMGENITVNTELINIGNKTVTIGYCEPWVAFEIKNQAGDEIWPKSQLACIPEFSGKKTLQPGEHVSVQPWSSVTAHAIIPPPRLSIPGNYVVLSVAVFTFNTNSKSLSSIEPLWSQPLQITVLPSNYVKNQTTNQPHLQEQLDIGQRHTIPPSLEASQKEEKQKEDMQNTTLVAIFVSVSIGVIISVFLLARRKK